MYDELWSLIDQESIAYQQYLSAKRGEDIGRVSPAKVRTARGFWYTCLDARLEEAKRLGAATGEKPSTVIRNALIDRVSGRAKVQRRK